MEGNVTARAEVAPSAVLSDPPTYTLTQDQLADLELRHRRRARCEDRIRCAKDTGLRNLPLHGYAQNQIWCEIVALACELLAWTAMLALPGPARRWEPRRLRLRIFAVASWIVFLSVVKGCTISSCWPIVASDHSYVPSNVESMN